MYEVEYFGDHNSALTANIITDNIFVHIDDEGHKFVNLYAIVNLRVNREEMQHGDDFIFHHNGGKRCRETTNG